MRLIVFIALFWFCLSLPDRLPAQPVGGDSIAYWMPFYFEDARGNRDTVYVGGSPYVEGDVITPAFGEVNLVEQPFDSVFEVRVTNGFSLLMGLDPVKYMGKVRVLEYTPGIDGTPCSQFGRIESFGFVTQVKYPPLNISWNPREFRQDPALSCVMGTSIVNTFSPATVNGWWNSDFPDGLDYTCLGVDSVKSFYPLNTPTGLDLTFNTFVEVTVSGSDQALDSLPAYWLYWDFSSRRPCQTVVSVDSRAIPPSYRFTLFPNPAYETVYFEASYGTGELQIFDFSGRRMYHSELAANRTGVDVRSWPPGVYCYTWKGEHGNFHGGKFVKR